MCAVLLTILFLSSASGYQQWKTLYDRVNQDAEFSEFRAMVKDNRIVSLNLLYRGITLFVPENDALHHHNGNFSDELAWYHMGTEPHTLKQLATTNAMQSVHVDNPPLWITVNDHYYVNNAKILEGFSNYVSKSKRNQTANQVLHVIDRVLDPMLVASYANASAYDFLEHHERWKLAGRKLNSFLSRIQQFSKHELFKRRGGHTFFIPVDDRIDEHRLQSIDSYIIEGHVIPNLVLFTRPAAKDFVYETAANGDYIYIVVDVLTRDGKDYVKSHTVLGNSDHKRGEVLAEIVQANIPLANGVVHLISQPLAVFDKELQPFPYLPVLYKIAADPDLNITYNLGKGVLNAILAQPTQTKTFFAPKNSAWVNFTADGSRALSDILQHHVVLASYTMSKLALMSRSDIVLESLGGPLRLQIRERDGGFYIGWEQKWVRVVRPNYECSDGVVHVVDGVFGTPKPAAATYGFWGMLKAAVG